MVNQWGRNGTTQSGGTGSGVGFLIPAVVALVVGAAAGYGSARYMSGVSATDIQSRDDKIDELEKTLSEIKFDDQGAEAEQGVLRERVKDLEGKLSKATREAQSAKDQSRAEIDALQKTLDEAGDLNGDLGRARKSQKVTELQILELEGTIKQQKGEIDALKAASDASAGDTAATLATLKKANDALRASLEDARKKLAAIPELESEVARLRRQIAAKGDGGPADLRPELDRLTSELDRRQKQLDEALHTASDATRGVKKAGVTIAQQLSEIRKLKDSNDTLAKSAAGLAKQVDDLKAQLVKQTPKPDNSVPAGDKPADTGMKPRDRADVERAIDGLPGYEALSGARQQMLITMLERGECVTTSLKAAYGHVPAVALRNLLRELGGRC